MGHPVFTSTSLCQVIASPLTSSSGPSRGVSCHRPIPLQELRQQVLHLQWDLPIPAGPGLPRAHFLHCHRDHAGELGQVACQRAAEPRGDKTVSVLAA